MWLKNIHLEDKTMEGEQIEIGQRDGLYFLGSNLTLRRCKVILRVPARRLLVTGVHFNDCDIEVKQELKNIRFEGATFHGCRFTGRMMGCEFGTWPGSKYPSSVEHCDFSGARLHLCGFVNCDTTTLRFPPWPCFTLLNPSERTEELKALPWPGRTRSLVVGAPPYAPNMKALTVHAPTYARMREASEEELRRVLEQAGGVLW